MNPSATGPLPAISDAKGRTMKQAVSLFADDRSVEISHLRRRRLFEHGVNSVTKRESKPFGQTQRDAAICIDSCRPIAGGRLRDKFGTRKCKTRSASGCRLVLSDFRFHP